MLCTIITYLWYDFVVVDDDVREQAQAFRENLILSHFHLSEEGTSNCIRIFWAGASEKASERVRGWGGWGETTDAVWKTVFGTFLHATTHEKCVYKSLRLPQNWIGTDRSGAFSGEKEIFHRALYRNWASGMRGEMDEMNMQITREKRTRQCFHTRNEINIFAKTFTISMSWWSGGKTRGVFDFKSSEFVRRLNDCKLHSHVSATRVPRDGIPCIC